MTLEPDAEPVRGGQLVVGLQAETSGWDPISNPFSQSGSYAISTIVEPLGVIDRDGVVQDWLAASWTPSADFRSWDIALRQDVTYHDGTPLDAINLKANLDERVKRSATRRAGVEYNITRVDVVSAFVARVSLKVPHAQLHVALAGTYMIPTERVINQATQQLHPLGTGPFVFSEWKEDQHLIVKASQRYWRRDAAGRLLPFLESIKFEPITDEAVRSKSLQAGDIDMAMSSSATIADALKDQFTVLEDNKSERTFVLLNAAEGEKNAPNPFTNVHARRALAHATNRQELTELAGPGVQSTPQPYRPGSPWALPGGREAYPEYDQEAAKREVAAYKADTGRPTLTFTLLLAGGTEERALLQAVQEQWTEVGIEAVLQDQEQAALVINTFAGNYTATGFRWFGLTNPEQNTPVVDTRLVAPVGNISLAFSRYSSPSLAANLERLQTEPDFAARQKASQAAWTEINEQALCIWLVDTPWSMIANKRVRGLNQFRSYPLGNFAPKPGWFSQVFLAA